ncbi:MAG: hypothetical protein DRI01_10575 [Chloroflexi bacterium]|nr:MAG: hypothetical protein DRI01_10575 [Chloroflexota bacterium]
MKRALKEFNLPFNAIFLYVETGAISIFGFAYWFVITKLVGADILGTVSAMASFAGLLGILIAVGIPVGSMRFLGKAYSQSQTEELPSFFTSALVLIGVSSLFGITLVIILRGQLQTIVGLPTTFFYLACLIAFIASMHSIFRTTFICIRRAQVIALSTVLGGVIRLGVGIVLVLLGFGALGAAIGYAMLPVVGFILLLASMLANTLLFARPKINFTLRLARELTRAGLANWLPSVILALGSQLGILIVYGVQGAAETGFYFIVYAIFSAVEAIQRCIWGVMFPVLSGMTDDRKRLTWKGITLVLVIIVPVAVSLFLCSKVILGFFGAEFLAADRALALLLASVVLIPIAKGIETLAYAYGRYRYVLLIGLVTNIPRVLLYIVLVPSYGADGAALAFLGGTLTGFICSVIVASRIGMILFWKQISLIVFLPVGIGVASYLLQLHWVLGIVLVFSVSFAGYLLLKIITRREIKEIISSLRLGPLVEKVWPVKVLLGD